MPDGYSIDEFHSSAATLIGSLENKLDKIAKAADQDAVRLARELQQLLQEIRGSFR
jgi:hypothetical protein